MRLGIGAWIDTDGNGLADSWQSLDGATLTSLADIQAQGGDADYDGLPDDLELSEATNPYNPDTDYDGILDGEEYSIVRPAMSLIGESISLHSWDSDGDGYSDFHEFHGCYSTPYANGQLPNYAGATFCDFDGDGLLNFIDGYPADPTNNDSDGDGINDSVDPDTTTSSAADNYSSANGISWYGDALSDADGDGILNYYDNSPYPEPGDPEDVPNPDRDGDSIPNEDDPFPDNLENFSPENGIYWYGSVLGDEDADGSPNYEDAWPYDGNNGNSTTNEPEGGTDGDTDDDGLPDNIDPAIEDDTNASPFNSMAWYGSALADDDQDEINNFNDPYPTDTFNEIPDFDNDGWLNADDPYPKDNSNTSLINGTPWYNDLFANLDGDAYPNWQDTFPNDPYDGNPDVDNDGLLNAVDPALRDPFNISEANDISWMSGGYDDWDNDTTPNFYDPTPYFATATNLDGDPFSYGDDPYPEDPTNTSDINGIVWGKDVNKDADNDGIQNYADEFPYDPFNNIADFDHDGLFNSTGNDPAPTDPTNYSPYNAERWHGFAMHDLDGDGIQNWYDALPRNGWRITDRDHDGILNLSDPYPDDATNLSMVNHIRWGAAVIADNDSDEIPNWTDRYPEDATNGANTDHDQDGLNAMQEQDFGTSDALVDSDDDGLTDYEEKILFNSDPLDPYSLSKARSNATHIHKDGTLADLTDSDGDLIPNKIEILYGLNPSNPDDANGDLDADGTSNLVQYNLGIALDAHLDAYDHDHDDMSDLYEDYWGFNKVDPSDAVLDRDGDHVLNFEERRLRLSPDNPDTLHSGHLGDWLLWLQANIAPELQTNTADANANDIPDWLDSILAPHPPAFFYPANPDDWDNDGLPDAWEHLYGQWRYPNGINLRTPDADLDGESGGGDGLSNLLEYQLDLSPVLSDSDGDGTSDANEDWDEDGLTNLQEVNLGTNAKLSDSDGNGISDADEDTDGDGLTTAQELSRGLNPSRYDDSDNDGVPDDWECFYGFDPFDGTDLGSDDDNDGVITRVEYSTWKTNPRNPDTDGDGITDFNDGAQAILNGLDAYAKANDKDFDGLTDTNEATAGTDPEKPDTDGDGLLDSWEVSYGYNPLSQRPTRAEVEAAANRHDLLPLLDDIESNELTLAQTTGTLATSPNAWDILRNRANAYLKLGRFDEALADYDRYLLARPADLDVRNDRAVARARTGLASPAAPTTTPAPVPTVGYEGALADLDKLLIAKPSWINARHNRALVLIQLERYDDAIADYDTLLNTDPNDPLAKGRKAHATKLLADTTAATTAEEPPTATTPSIGGAPSGHNFKPNDLTWTLEGIANLTPFIGHQVALLTDNTPAIQGLDHAANLSDYFTTFQSDPAELKSSPQASPGQTGASTTGTASPLSYPRPDTLLHLTEADLDSDGDHLTNEQEHATYQPYADPTTTLHPRQALDADGDLLPDDWESYYDLHNGPNPSPSSVTTPPVTTPSAPVPSQDHPTDDPDDDGLTNLEEYFWTNTSPREADTNHNGYTDAQDQMRFFKEQLQSFSDTDNAGQVNSIGLGQDAATTWVQNQLHIPSNNSNSTNPNSPANANDLDGDGLSNTDETLYGTRPDLADTDGGGVSDGAEVQAWKAAGSKTGHDPLLASDDSEQADSDKDGLTTADEKKERTDPNNPDTDGGGINDGDEVRARSTAPRDGADNPIFGNPLKASDDTQSDDTDNDGLSNGEETAEGTLPNNPDTDGGGIQDGAEVHSRTGQNHWEPLIDSDDDDQTDTDGDGMPDTWENSNNLDLNDPTDATQDADADDLKNVEEYRNDTDPNNADTDQGGIEDGVEVKNKKAGQTDPPLPTDPLDPQDDQNQPQCACVDINGVANPDATCFCGSTWVDNPEYLSGSSNDPGEWVSNCHCGPCDCDYLGAGGPSDATYCGGQGGCGHDDCGCDDACNCAPGTDACGGNKGCRANACICSAPAPPGPEDCACANNDCAGSGTCGDNCSCSPPPCGCPTSASCGGHCSDCTCGDCSACGCKDESAASTCSVASPGTCSCQAPGTDCDACGCNGIQGANCTGHCTCAGAPPQECSDHCGCNGTGSCSDTMTDCGCTPPDHCAGGDPNGNRCCTSPNACSGNCSKTGCACTPPPCSSCGCNGTPDTSTCGDPTHCACTTPGTGTPPGGGGGGGTPPGGGGTPPGGGGDGGTGGTTPTQPTPKRPDKPEKAPGTADARHRALGVGPWIYDPTLPKDFADWLVRLFEDIKNGKVKPGEAPSEEAAAVITRIAEEVAKGKATFEILPTSIKPIIQKGLDAAKNKDIKPPLPLPPKPSLIGEIAGWVRDLFKSEPKKPTLDDQPPAEPDDEGADWEVNGITVHLNDPRVVDELNLYAKLLEKAATEQNPPLNETEQKQWVEDQLNKVVAFIDINGPDSIVINPGGNGSSLGQIDGDGDKLKNTINIGGGLDALTAATEIGRLVGKAFQDDGEVQTRWLLYAGNDRDATEVMEQVTSAVQAASRQFCKDIVAGLKTGASILNEGADIAISLKDAYDGDYWALIGLIPLIPGSARKLVKLTNKAGDVVNLAPGATTKEIAEALLDCAGLCFTGDTPVLTATGLKRIDDIHFGDRVWARDEATGKEGWQRVLDTIATHPSELVLLTCQLEDGSRHTVRGTANHPVWSQTQQKFIDMGQLQAGDHLLLAQHHGTATVQALSFEPAPPGTTFTTYNLHVNQWHTYFVALGEGATGKAGPPAFWVHNTGNGLCAEGKELLGTLLDSSKSAQTPITPKDALKLIQEGGGAEFKVYKTFDSLKNNLPDPGEGNVYHHLVEQAQMTTFGQEAIQNSGNVVPISAELNHELNRLYSSKNADITGSTTLTIRDWLRTQNYSANRDFGHEALEKVKNGSWRLPPR